MIMCFLLLLSASVNSQTIPVDTALTEGETLVLLFNFSAIDNAGTKNNPEPGDYYGLRSNSNSVSAIDTDNRLTEGENIIRISLDSARYQDISLIFRKQDKGCLMSASDIESVQHGDTILISRLMIAPQKVIWERKQVCENDPLPVYPYITGDLQNLTFSSTDGLIIDTNSGIVIPSGQTPGRYSIQYYSQFCLENSSDTLVIRPKPSFQIERQRKLCEGRSIELSPVSAEPNTYSWSDGSLTENLIVSTPGQYTVSARNEYGCILSDTINVEPKTIRIAEPIDYETTPADCYEKGTVNIKQANVINGSMPYIYKYENIISKEELKNPQRLKEGEYTLTIEDADGCITKADETISIGKDCLNDYPVFTPNTDGMDDEYYISEEGEAVVYDRNGIERHRFMAPAYWDGNDDNGNPLPMGTYVIVVGGKKFINITIIK